MRRSACVLVLGLAGCFETEDLSTAGPGAFGLTAPADGATDVATTPAYSWAASAGAASYTLQVSTSSTFAAFVTNQSGILATTASPATVLGFATTYYWRVYADSASGSTLAAGAPWSFTTLPPLPGAFSPISPANGAPGILTTPTYSWSASSDAASYTLQISTSAVFASFVVNQSGIATTSTTPGAALSTSTTYYWRVYADNSTGSTLSTGAPWSFTTVPPPPGAFTMTAPADGSSGVSATPTYSWNASSDAASYTLQVSTSAVFASFVVNQSGIATTSATPGTALAHATTHFWRVYADNASGSTLATGSPRSFTTRIPPPGAFLLIGPGDGSTAVSTTPLYSWSAASNATSYTLQVSTSPVFASFVIDQPGLATTSARPATVLATGIPHYWRVSAHNSSGSTLTASTAFSFTTTGAPNFTLSAPSLAFTLTEGGADPADQTLDLTDSGALGNPVAWTAATDQPWVTVTPSSGGSIPAQVTTLTVHVQAVYQAGGWVGSTTTAGAPSARRLHTAVWAGNQMVVWGGSQTPGAQFSDGGRYDPVGNVWLGTTSAAGAPTPRHGHTGVWTGTDMAVWGGVGTTTSFVNTGGLYAPDAWVGSTSLFGAPAVRETHAAVWTGGEMIVWAGWNNSLLVSGGRYNRAGDLWTDSTSIVGHPGGRLEHVAVWSGSRMVVWGGRNGGDASSSLNTGGFYDPGVDQWTGSTSLAGVPSARTAPSAVFTGREMILWGGHDGANYLDTGARFLPETNTWLAALPTSGAPAPRYRHRAVWTGSRMIVWGGEDGSGALDTGGIYQPPIPGLGTHDVLLTVTASGAGETRVQTIPITVTVNP